MRKTKASATAATPKTKSKSNPATLRERAMVFEKEDIAVIYHALQAYKPTQEEVQLHSIWVEGFEQVLFCDYGEDLEILY
jgi:hypothetical protein